MERAEHAHGDGHGGHAGMSMAAMALDMRNRFLVAALFAIDEETLVAALHDGSIVRSDSGGMTWEVRATS